MALDVADYVIVHELLHFFVPKASYGKAFMRAHRGDYEAMERRLKLSS